MVHRRRLRIGERTDDRLRIGNVELSGEGRRLAEVLVGDVVADGAGDGVAGERAVLVVAGWLRERWRPGVDHLRLERLLVVGVDRKLTLAHRAVAAEADVGD